MQIGERYQVTTESVNIFGNGVCRIDGIAVFVIGALCGECCEIQITKIAKNYAFAQTVSFQKISPKRIESSCPVFPTCQGCQFQTCTIDAENEVKEQYLKHLFDSAELSAKILPIVTAQTEHYRNKVILFYQDGAFGYYTEDYRVIPHRQCNLNPPLFDEIAKATAQAIGQKDLRALLLRQTSRGQVLYCPIFSRETSCDFSEVLNRFPQIVCTYLGVCREKDFALERTKFFHRAGKRTIFDTLCGLDFEISPQSFYQINHDCAELLYETAISLLPEAKTCADLFCGTGTIGLLYAKAHPSATVYGVEIEKEAVENAKINAEINQISNVSFFCGKAEDFNQTVDACLIDPPRKGCTETMIQTLLRLHPKKIVYISCNPQALTRDISALSEQYQIDSPITPFNMFPRTSHLESVVRLTTK